MSLSLIRAEYKTILETIPGIGVVHDYARLATDWAKFLELYKDPTTEKILGWEITREAVPAQSYMLSGMANRSHAILIRGYAGLQDASGTETVFQNLIEAVLDTFLPLHTLNDKVLVAQPMVVSTVTERMFGSVLCHYCEIRQTVQERISY